MAVKEDAHNADNEAQRAPDVSQQMLIRRQKVDKLRAQGIDPYGVESFDRTHGAAEIKDNFLELDNSEVTLAGRIISIRTHGKASFAHLRDMTGTIQIYVRVNEVGEEAYSRFLDLDIGDILGLTGKVFKTRRGEVTIAVRDYQLLSKALRPLPEKWHGLKDVELRYRMRYVDLIANPEIRQIFVTRSKIIKGLREYLDQRGFLEVETPMLSLIAGGANARPFVTYHNALDTQLYLRIAPELYLKRLVVGGMEKVYELNRNFRNEGISTKHNPEYTALEVYQAYADGEVMMKLTEDLIAHVAQEVTGATVITYQGQTLDLTPPWRRLTMIDAIREYGGVDFTPVKDAAAACQLAEGLGLKFDEGRAVTVGQVMAEVFDAFVEPKLIQPTFITEYPVEISPLSKRLADKPDFTARFEPFIYGREMANGFSELNDPIDQRERFQEQVEQREAGDEEAHMMDEDYIRALEYGLPPTGGLGIGIDRLVMLLTDSYSIRDVLLFPLLKPKE